MKITKEQLEQIIREELESALNEYEGLPGDVFRFEPDKEEDWLDKLRRMTPEERAALQREKDAEADATERFASQSGGRKRRESPWETAARKRKDLEHRGH